MAFKQITIKCPDCGNEFTVKGPNQDRCRNCQSKRRNEIDKEIKRNNRKSSVNTQPDKKDSNVCGERARKCFYGGRMGTTYGCMYKLKTGRRRPCAVQGCTEYIPKKESNLAERFRM